MILQTQHGTRAIAHSPLPIPQLPPNLSSGPRSLSRGQLQAAKRIVHRASGWELAGGL